MSNFLTQEGMVPSEDETPSWLVAADNHNLGNTRGGSWFNPTTWGDKLEGAGKLISTGVLSGVNSFYNTGVAIGNWFGANGAERDTEAWIASLDSNLGEYYHENRAAADLLGFVAGSFAPGLAGIKVLNAGQKVLSTASKTGLFGTNLSRATGLLVPNTERYIALAARDINAASASFSAINTNTLKALASGVYQNALEGAAFETMVQATMFRSPILEGQDHWDILKNITIGAAFGGIVGGAFQGARSIGEVKGLVKAEQARLTPLGSRELPIRGTEADERIILLVEDKGRKAQPFAGSENYEAARRLYEDSVRRIDNDIRTSAHSLVKGGDTEAGNMLADSIHGLDHETVLANMLHTRQVSRLGVVHDLERTQAELAKKGVPDPTISTQYLKLIGEDAGLVTDQLPVVPNLADFVSKGGRDSVLAAVRDYGFKPGQNWSVLSLSGKDAHFHAEARYLWADVLLKEIKPGTEINHFDIPLLQRALRDGQLDIKLVDDAGGVLRTGFVSSRELEEHIIRVQDEANYVLMKDGVLAGKIPTEQGTTAIGKITNTKVSRIEGTIGDPSKDYFAWQEGVKGYKSFLEGRGLTTAANESVDPRFLPSHLKITKQLKDMTDVDGHVLDGMTYLKQNQKLLQEGIDRVVSKELGDLYGLAPEITDSALLDASRSGAGAKLFAFANGSYGSLESFVQMMGGVTKQVKDKFRKTTGDQFTGVLTKMGQKQDASIEFATINQKVSRSGKQWVRGTDDSGVGQYLFTKDAKKMLEDERLAYSIEDAIADGSALRIHNSEVVDVIDAHISRAGSRTGTWQELHAAFGKTDVKDPNVFRPIRPNPKDYKHFAFVKDPSVTGAGHTTMIFAESPDKLQKLVDQVPKKYTVLTKRDTEDFFRARGEYEYQRTLHENYIDSDLKSRGIFSDFFTKTDPQKIIDDILQQHFREDDALAVELMRARNTRAFSWLEDQGSYYSKIETSKFGTYSDKLERAGVNPYYDYIKTALDISKIGEHPLLYSFNKFLDSAVSRAVEAIGDTWNNWRNPLDEAQIAAINSSLSKYGMNTGYDVAATNLWVNHTAPKGELTKFIRGANAVLAKLTLGMDPLNALNNAIGANILRTTELKQITDAIKSGDTAIAGELGKLLKVDLPGGVGQITSPGKLIARAIANFASKDSRETLIPQYKAAGYIKDLTTQFHDILDDFTLKGTESVGELNSRLKGAFTKAKALSETGERLTGNKLAEEFNRFVSADVMRQITDVGVSSGLLTKAEQAAYINTFVNRVEGVTIASQRPLMFQGPIGQAVGLFQSYQFNLMQQMFRYVSEGTGKDAAMLLGLQGTFYGMQGLPAFQFINQHVVGTLSGNKAHTDLYDATYGIAGRQVADLLMYGIPSNLIQANIYSRGDINPRQVTVLPTTLPEIPFIGAYGKFLSSMKSSLDKVSMGGNVWESVLQGLEHNGLSRPLAGLAQVLQATGPGGVPYSTTSKGSILFSNDLMSWASAVRLAGGRPLDEAILNDAVFRIQSYQAYDKNKMQHLAGAVKSATIQGNIPTSEDVVGFAKLYAESGGKQVNFNKYMIQEYKAANTSQSQKILAQLQNPFAQKMQLLMGGAVE